MEIKETFKGFLKLFKYPIIIILSLLIFYLGAESGYQLKYKLELWKNVRSLEQINKSLIDLFKNDIYGGKTPEETFNLFIEAMKNEDVDLAVKYFVLDIDRRMDMKERFDELKEEGKLKEYGEWFPVWKDMTIKKTGDNNVTAEFFWTQNEDEIKMMPDGAGGYIEVTFPAGKYRRTIDFVKSYNNIWKIENF